MRVLLHSEQPDRQIRPTLEELARNAVRIDLAVAFVTKYGVDTILAIKDQLGGRAEIRLIVSVLYPTDLGAVAKLAKSIDVSVHCGYVERAENEYGQFHSKIGLIERAGEARTIVVGSHHLTMNGLDGRNLEASLIVDCIESDAIVSQTRDHIEECSRSPECERFDPARIPFYEAIQREFHTKLTDRAKAAFGGFDKCGERIVMLAERGMQELPEAMELFLEVPRAWNRHVGTGTPAWILVFPRSSLFGRHYPFPCPDLYVGEVAAAEARSTQSLEADSEIYLVHDITEPVVETVTSRPPRSANTVEVVILLQRKHQVSVIPVFHTTKEPHAKLELDIVPEHKLAEHVPRPVRQAMSLITTRRRPRTIPAGLIAKVILNVPFTFVYPQSLATKLEAYGNRQSLFPGDAPCRVEFRRPRSISEYICRVQCESDNDLTLAIHS